MRVKKIMGNAMIAVGAGVPIGGGLCALAIEKGIWWAVGSVVFIILCVFLIVKGVTLSVENN